MSKTLPVQNSIQITAYIRFWATVCLRFCRIFFKANKTIVLQYVKLSDLSLVGGKYQKLRYKFQNALYFEILLIDKTINNEIIITGSADENRDLALTVYGFFDKRQYKLSEFNQHHILKRTFLTEIVPLKHNIKTRQIKLYDKSLILRSHPVKFSHKNVKIYHSPFSLNDFI